MMKKQPINSIWSYMLLMGSVMMFTSTITYGEQKIVSFEELSDNHELAVPSYTAVCDETNIVKAEPGDVLKYLMEQGPIQKSFSSIPDSNLDMQSSFLPTSFNSHEELSFLEIERKMNYSKSGEKTTGHYTLGADVNDVIPDHGGRTYPYKTSETLPAGAYITNVKFSIRIDDNGDESHFWCSDYEISITTASYSPDNVIIWDNLGGHTDGGYDDDAADDSDIYLELRSTSAFNGEPADQWFYLIINDVTSNSSSGLVDNMLIFVFWETPNPDLTYYTPSGWDAPIVISSVPGTHTSSPLLIAEQTVYIDIAFINRGSSTSNGFYIYLNHGAPLINLFYHGAIIGQDQYITIEDYPYVCPRNFAGSETFVYLTLDPEDYVHESDETNNQYILAATWICTPEPPELWEPLDGTTCKSVNPTLSWVESEFASTYRLQVDNNSDFSSPEYNQGSISATEQTVSGLNYNTTFYWRVNATNEAGTSSYSEIRSFTTSPSPLPKVTLISPANNSTDHPTSVTLSWQPVSGASNYWVQVNTSSNFNSPWFSHPDMYPTSCTIQNLTEGTTYYWRIRANRTCSSGDWSNIWSFKTAPSSSGPSDITDINLINYSLGQNYPNPFMKTTTIDFAIPVDGEVSFEFLDLQGKIIATYTDYYPAGQHSKEVTVNENFLPGVYIYRMKTNDFVDTKLCVVR